MKKIFTLLAIGACAFLHANSQSSTVVISIVYSGGGSASGTYIYDLVELHNKSNVPQDISGYSLQYASSTGNFPTSGSNIFPFGAGTIIPAGGYLSVRCGTAGSGTTPIAFPVTPDSVATGLSMGAGAGKVALVNTTSSIGCGATATPCPLPGTVIVDIVAWGTSNNAEGGAAVGALSATTAAVRKSNGCQDTDNNLNDFDVVPASSMTIHNSASPIWNCVIMPVSLKSFSASLINKKAQLKWSTVNEVNMKGFSVLKSTNGVDFTEAIFINAQNGTQNNYTIADDFNTNVAYYRLKMVEKDGSFKYSEIVSVNNRVSPKLEIFPNPVTNNVILSHPKANNAVVRIISLDGKTQMTYVVENGATQSSIGVSQLIRGSYIAIFDNEGVSSNVQFVKQ